MAKRDHSSVYVQALYAHVQAALDYEDEQGRKIGDAKHGVYAFFDYDEEPIYVGQTKESLRTRIRRHLTGQRADAVAKRVLDPYEVSAIEMWPFWEVKGSESEVKELLNRAEYTVYQRVIENSKFKEVLNEGEIAESEIIDLPDGFRFPIVPDEIRKVQSHPDIRLARRAWVIADLARIISEREVSPGLRKTLLVQARRLEQLASDRYKEILGEDGED